MNNGFVLLIGGTDWRRKTGDLLAASHVTGMRPLETDSIVVASRHLRRRDVVVVVFQGAGQETVACATELARLTLQRDSTVDRVIIYDELGASRAEEDAPLVAWARNDGHLADLVNDSLNDTAAYNNEASGAKKM